MILPQSYLLIEIVPIIFLHVKIVIAIFSCSCVAGATPLHSTSPPRYVAPVVTTLPHLTHYTGLQASPWAYAHIFGLRACLHLYKTYLTNFVRLHAPHVMDV